MSQKQVDELENIETENQNYWEKGQEELTEAEILERVKKELEKRKRKNPEYWESEPITDVGEQGETQHPEGTAKEILNWAEEPNKEGD